MVQCPDSGHFTGSRRRTAKTLDVGKNLMAQAFAVMEHAPDLAPEVMAKFLDSKDFEPSKAVATTRN